MNTVNADDIIKGLLDFPKHIPSKYLYDEEGSQIFNEITKLDEYYLTRCEKEILEDNAATFAHLFGPQRFNLIELGGGDGSKASIMIANLNKAKLDFSYFAVDISPRALQTLRGNLSQKFKDIPLHTFLGDYTSGLEKIIQAYPKTKNVILFLGSSIGNFEPRDAEAFMKNIAHHMKPEDILVIGFDLKKDERILSRAYNDKEGLTAEFNFNLLHRLNKEYGANFVPENFKHIEVYNPGLEAMESYLISTKDQVITFEDHDLEISLTQDEMIHTEYSFKFDVSRIKKMIHDTGLRSEMFLFDKKNYFTVALFQGPIRH